MKKGCTLIELVITISIISTLFIFETDILTRVTKNYKKIIIEDRQESYCREALRFIEMEIHDIGNKNIKIEKDTLILKKSNGNKNRIKLMRKSNGKSKIIIIYDNNKTNRQTEDTIVENIKDFKIIEDRNLIFISIKSREGRKYERCFGIEKNKRDL